MQLITSETFVLYSWDQQYVTELENFQNHGDIGEIWFGKKVMQVVVEWVSTKFEHDTEIMDLGCGNGAVLLQLVNLIL